MIKLYIKQLRPKNWLKNVFLFVPLVFSMQLFNPNKVFFTLIAFTAFCLVSSGAYVINDICDAEKDAAHPTKCHRPIASGMITKRRAAVYSVLIVFFGLATAFTVSHIVCLFAVAYLALNLSYTLVLKHMPIFDCFSIAMGFVLRVITGGFACGEYVSDFLFLTVFTMSLFMAFGKRRGEILKVDPSDQRTVLKHYNLPFLDAMTFTCASLSIVFYSLWSMNRGLNMIFTVPIVIFIVLKYLLLINDKDSYGDPTEVILADKTLLAACIVYVSATVALLYAGNLT
jgi:4-hydroxybenzoate polyprenyltransferase